MADPRFEKINELFINYSLGNFDYQIPLSSKLDEIDAFISNINMLGEELKATTISKNYFNNIFNSVSDIIFIMDKNGKVRDMNAVGFALFGVKPEKIANINMFHLFYNKSELALFKKQLNEFQSVINMRIKLLDKNGKVIESLVSVNKVEDKGTGVMVYQGIIKDITKEKEMENLVIRTIIDTQEKERERFAKDLHDSLGQQLSGIKFYFEALRKLDENSDKKKTALLIKSGEAINYASSELRNICFNLMPRTLENFGLTSAVLELCEKIESAGMLHFSLSIDKHFPALNKPLEIALFRIVQEFLNNAMKHGKAKKIRIVMKCKNNLVHITLRDNGSGFNMNDLSKYQGMGLRNVKSRVNSYNGEVKIESSPAKGTLYDISIPI